MDDVDFPYEPIVHLIAWIISLGAEFRQSFGAENFRQSGWGFAIVRTV
ncbi:hypothetical protein BH23PLA1_BH23PLA1_34470 [soil metagenome]